MEGGRSGKIYQQNVFSLCIQTVFKGHLSFVMSCSLKVTQYMHQPTSQLYSIWMSVLIVCIGSSFLAKIKEKFMICVVWPSVQFILLV